MPKKKKDKFKEESIAAEQPVNGAAAEEIEQSESSDVEPELAEIGEALDDDSIPVDEKLELIKAAWEASEEKAAEYLDGWQRAKAEFSNYKKRVVRDREQFNREAVGKVVKNYLSVVDDLERALKDQPKDDDITAWASGIELIYRKLVTMDVNGKVFDPNLHEAIAQIESSDHESGQIVEVIQTGYMVGERVLRPARVCIAS